MKAVHEDAHPLLGSGPSDPEPVFADVRRATLGDEHEIRRVRTALWERHAQDLLRAADVLVTCFRAGGTVLAFGNGGCGTAAMDVVHDLMRPATTSLRSLPALDLACEACVLTAVADDLGVERTFERQIHALGREGDVAIGFSTDGESRSVLEAFERARALGLRTIAFTGRDGGRLVREAKPDVALVVPSEHALRIQEAHSTAWHALLAMVHRVLGAASSAGESSTEAA